MQPLTLFQLSCLCVSHCPASVADVRFGSVMTSSEGPELGEIVKPLQSYSLSCNTEPNIIADPGSVGECVELLKFFVGTALGSGYDA